MPRPVEWVKVALAPDLPPGSLRMVQAGERWYALANVDGTFHAFDNNCPHNGGPLGKGRLVDGSIECPWHLWSWDVATGRATWPPTTWRLQAIPVRRDGDDLLLPLL